MPCEQEVLLTLQRLIICSDTFIDILNKSIRVEQIKSSVHHAHSHRSDVDHNYSSSRSSLNQETLLSNSICDQKCSVRCKLAEIKKSLQYGMAQHDTGGDHDETENDSGFHEGSGGLQHHPSFDTRIDLEKLEKNGHELSQCHFYFGSIDSQAAKDLLWKKPTGTFLIRDSSHCQYLYSLSVKTERGATSVRILYNNGLFQFDSDERIRKKLPQFDTILGMLDFHVRVTHDGVSKSWQWEETSGRKSMKVTLTKPLRSSIPSLSHLSRVKINQCLDNVYLPHQVGQLPLINDKLKDFIKDYPYRI